MSDPLRLDLDVLLPDAPHGDACAARLAGELATIDGVERAHVVPAGDGGPAQLCLHYDPDAVSVPRLRRAAERTGARLTERYGHVVWPADGLYRQRRARTVAEHLRKLPGVVEAEANATGPVRVEFDREQATEADLRRALADLGVTVPANDPPEVQALPAEPPAVDEPEVGASHHAGHDHAPGEGHDDDHSGHGHAPGAHGGHDHGGIFGAKTELIFAVLSGVCVGLGWALDSFTDVAAWVPLGLFLGAYLFGGWFTVREAYDSIRAGRFEIDFLMLVAAAGAAALGEWFEGGLLLFLFSIGHALEGYAMGRARRAIEALAELAPATRPRPPGRAGDRRPGRGPEGGRHRRRPPPTSGSPPTASWSRARARSIRPPSRARASPWTSSPRPTARRRSRRPATSSPSTACSPER